MRHLKWRLSHTIISENGELLIYILKLCFLFSDLKQNFYMYIKNHLSQSLSLHVGTLINDKYLLNSSKKGLL